MLPDQFEFEFMYGGRIVEATCYVNLLLTLSIYSIVFNDADFVVSSFVLYRENNGNFLWFDKSGSEQKIIKAIVKGIRTAKVK